MKISSFVNQDIFTKTLRSKDFIFFVVTVLIMVIMVIFGSRSSLWQTPDRNPTDAHFLSGRVREVIEDNTGVNEVGARVGTQLLRVELRQGEHRGETITVQNRLFPIEHAIHAQIGDRVLVFFQPGSADSLEGYFSHLQSYDRTIGIYIIITAFVALLITVFGKSGLRAAFGLVFTIVMLVFFLLPLVALGFPPGILTVLSAVVIVIVSIIAIMGFGKKTLASILGSCFGILCYVLFYFLITFVLRLDGFNISQIDTLIIAGVGIGVRELLFSSILITSLGGIMDVAVSLASAIFELSQSLKKPTFKVLLKSGMKVSRDIIGSSANTLILAFTGSFLISLILFAITNTNYQVLVNRVDIGIEILRAFAASSAMIVCAPVTVLISASKFAKS